MSTPETSRARYVKRKLAGLCVHCSAGLTEDDGLSCVECEEKRRQWRATPGGKASVRRSNRRYLQSEAGKQANRAKSARRRQEAAAKGLCLECSERATRGRMCERHAAAQNARSKAWRARQGGLR